VEIKQILSLERVDFVIKNSSKISYRSTLSNFPKLKTLFVLKQR